MVHIETESRAKIILTGEDIDTLVRVLSLAHRELEMGNSVFETSTSSKMLILAKKIMNELPCSW